MIRANGWIVAACLTLSVAAYWMVGRPGMGGQPMSERQDALAQKVQAAPQSLTPGEAMSLLEQKVLEDPKDPQPHFFIGEMLRAQGRPEDAMRAYQSALRRDDTFVPALAALADVMVAIGGGGVGPEATQLYARAYELDPENQVRSGMWAAMGAAQAGDQAKAEQAMRYIFNRLDADDPRRERFGAMIEAIGQGDGTPPE